MLRRSRTRFKGISATLLLILAVIYNEFLVYEITQWKWPRKDCSDCVKILLVADPQILGERDENYFGRWFALWDSDRYVSKTFARALSHTQPNVVVFLGDLMDEGRIADHDEFNRYKQRFDNIFDTHEEVMKIYLPGDNDIGGEDEPVYNTFHRRFNFAFTQSDTLIFKSVIFFKVNKLTRYVPKPPKEAFLNEYRERNVTNVVLSHLPLLFKPGSFAGDVIKELSAQVIFTAHDHRARRVTFDVTSEQLSEIRPFPKSPKYPTFYQLRLDMDEVHEFQVPTCSYRMGTADMGYGFALIDTQQKVMDFAILWLPSRFPGLIGYVIVVTIIILIYVFTSVWFCKCTSGQVAYSRIPRV